MIIPADYAQVNLRWTNADNEHDPECTFGLNVDLYAAGPDILAKDVSDLYGVSNFEGVQAADMTLVEVSVKYGPNATGPSAIWATSQPGVVTQDSVPSNTAVIIRKNTSDGGRAGRGRFYFPGVPEDSVDGGGNLDGTYLTDFQGIADAFLDGLAALLAPMVVLHSAGSPITTPSLVTSLTVLQRCGTQRDRMR